MNVITVALCKAGTGKTTLTAQLAAHACAQGRRCLVIDADPRGTFALLNSRRAEGALPAATARSGIERQLEVAAMLGYDLAIIDTEPSITLAMQEAIRVATMLIIPARPGFLDLAAVRETSELVCSGSRPYAVVINAAPARCDDKDTPMVAETRAFLDRYGIPVWSGQISERTGYVLAAGEADARSLAAAEIARLWSMIERSVEAMNAAGVGVGEARAAA